MVGWVVKRQRKSAEGWRSGQSGGSLTVDLELDKPNQHVRNIKCFSERIFFANSTVLLSHIGNTKMGDLYK